MHFLPYRNEQYQRTLQRICHSLHLSGRKSRSRWKNPAEPVNKKVENFKPQQKKPYLPYKLPQIPAPGTSSPTQEMALFPLNPMTIVAGSILPPKDP